MYRGHTITLVIPALNEEDGLEDVLMKAPKEIDQIIVVDGGSSDRTVEIAEKYHAKVLVEKKRGYGRAYIVGFKEATTDLIVTTDGDGTYPVESIPTLIDVLLDRKSSFVSGCRFPLRNVESMHFKNFIGNLIMTAFVALLFRKKVNDIASGMWLFRREILQRIRLIDSKWNFSLEIKIEALLHRSINFIEYPIGYSERFGETRTQMQWLVGFRALLFSVKKLIIYIVHKKKYTP